MICIYIVYMYIVYYVLYKHVQCTLYFVLVFLVQSDREKHEGLPVAPFMDRSKVTKPTAQIGFIKYVLIPLYETLGMVSNRSQVRCMEQQTRYW